MEDPRHLRPLNTGALSAQLRTRVCGRHVLYYPEIGSTNELAVQLAASAAQEGTLVLADSQPAGKGRLGRRWYDQPCANIALSLILYPPFPPAYLVMASAVALQQALSGHLGLVARLKWPNDVLLNEKKVAGILIETGSSTANRPYAVVGVGVNVNTSMADFPDLLGRATSIREVLGVEIPRETLISAFLQEFEQLYDRLGHSGAAGEHAIHDLWQTWRAGLATLGREVRIDLQGRLLSGLAEEVTPEGALLIRQSDGTLVPVTWGDVSA